MPRFVILEHDHPTLHWDLMLEAGEILQTWRLARPPAMNCAPIDATPLPDHRLMYLVYEGPVTGDRGTVRHWDTGVFVEEADSAPTRRVICVHGGKITGRVVLEEVAGARWRWIWPTP